MARKYHARREEIRCGLADYSKVLQSIITEYGEEARDEIGDAMRATGKELVKEVKARSPKRRGNYRMGWRSETKEFRLDASTVIYQQNSYQLTHLLEFGHALYQGGRYKGEVEGKPHMAPVQDMAPDVFERKLREAMG